ncbi:MAG: hypothetical protein R3F30_15240 [Planctomycetota bacterium]
MVLLTPLAVLRPHARSVPERELALAVQCLIRPWVLLGGEVEAATSPPRAEVGALRAAFEDALSAPPPSFPGFTSVPLRVRRAEGNGGAGWPDILWLEAPGIDPGRLEGRAVLRGYDLVGFVRSRPRAPGEPGEGLVRVELLCHRREGDLPQRIAGEARSLARTAEGPVDAPLIRAIVEGAEPDDPLPLRSVRSAPEQCDTGRPGVAPWPYVLRTMAGTELHPELPAGLVVGVLRDRVYAAEGFVQQRYVLPRWHPLSLVRVEVLVPRAEAAGLHGGEPELGRTRPARVLWSSPEGLGFRRHLLRGRGLVAGAAVVAGGRCLGRIEAVLGDLAVAAPLSRRGAVVPLLMLGADGHLAALVVEGLGSAAGAERFRILHPDPPRDLGRGTLHTGTLGQEFPSGLLLAMELDQDGAELRVRDFELRHWPAEVEVLTGVAP